MCLFFRLQRKTTKSKIKRVYIVRPARKSIQKHLANELGSKKKGNTRLNAQVCVDINTIVRFRSP